MPARIPPTYLTRSTFARQRSLPISATTVAMPAPTSMPVIGMNALMIGSSAGINATYAKRRTDRSCATPPRIIRTGALALWRSGAQGRRLRRWRSGAPVLRAPVRPVETNGRRQRE